MFQTNKENNNGSLKFKKAFVTGATGFVGANLVRELLSRDISVTALVRKSSDLKNLEGLDLEVVYGDLQDKPSLLKAIARSKLVFHVAAEYSFWSPDPESIFKNNVDGTRNILEACRELDVEKTVYTSTVGTIGLNPTNGGSSNEEIPLLENQFTGPYKSSKYEVEKLVLEFAKSGLPAVLDAVNWYAERGYFKRFKKRSMKNEHTVSTSC